MTNNLQRRKCHFKKPHTCLSFNSSIFQKLPGRECRINLIPCEDTFFHFSSEIKIGLFHNSTWGKKKKGKKGTGFGWDTEGFFRHSSWCGTMFWISAGNSVDYKGHQKGKNSITWTTRRDRFWKEKPFCKSNVMREYKVPCDICTNCNKLNVCISS